MSPHLLSQSFFFSPPPPSLSLLSSPNMKCLIFPAADSASLLSVTSSPDFSAHPLLAHPLFAHPFQEENSSSRSHCAAISICPLVEHPSLSSPCARSIVFLPLHCLSPLGRHKSVWSLSPLSSLFRVPRWQPGGGSSLGVESEAVAHGRWESIKKKNKTSGRKNTARSACLVQLGMCS